MAVVTVTGLPELEAKLLGFEVKVRPALLGTTRPGAKILRDAIKAEAPVGKVARPQQNDTPGNLRDSVKFKASRKRTGFTGQTIGAFGKGSAHRYLVIAGHNIKGHGRSVGGVKLSVKHFGHQAIGGADRTTPNPFVQRGREQAESAALAATEIAAAAALEKAARL